MNESTHTFDTLKTIHSYARDNAPPSGRIELIAQRLGLMQEKKPGIELRESLSIDEVRDTLNRILSYGDLRKQFSDETFVRGMCESISVFLQEALLIQGVGSELVTSSHEDPNHKSLVVQRDEGNPDNDIVIDGSILQFIPGYRDEVLGGVYLGTRNQLRDMIVDGDLGITNSRSKDNRPEFFERTYGSSVIVTRNAAGAIRSLQKRGIVL